MHSRGISNLNLDCSNLSRWDEQEDTQLYHHIVNYPQEVVPLIDLVVNEIYRISFGLDENTPQVIRIRPFNLLKLKKMRDLNPVGT
jgi:DNA replication licensing factor MCM4